MLAESPIVAPSGRQPGGNSFDATAAFYDGQPNPMTALEERFLPGLLPNLRGLDVLDVGCGTGRWLHQLQDLPVRSLTGIDASKGMLRIARTKLMRGITLYHGYASSLPLADESVDVILPCGRGVTIWN
jgi:ubiquinone/menaquinone biosynthesis C-methylase UbiE